MPVHVNNAQKNGKLLLTYKKNITCSAKEDSE